MTCGIHSDTIKGVPQISRTERKDGENHQFQNVSILCQAHDLPRALKIIRESEMREVERLYLEGSASS